MSRQYFDTDIYRNHNKQTDHCGLIFFDSKPEYISQKICIPIPVPGIFLLMIQFHFHFRSYKKVALGKLKIPNRNTYTK